MGILPATFLRRAPRLPVSSAHRRPFQHRDKKGPANCRAFSNRKVPSLGRFLFDD
jgi:hypothetical protein